MPAPAAPERVLVSADAVGGVWTYALELARALAARGVEVHLAVLGPAPGAAERAEAAAVPGLGLIETGLPLDWTADSAGELAAVTDALMALARRLRAELVHLNGPALAGPRRWPLPLVVGAHSCTGTWWRAVRGADPPAAEAWRIAATAAGLRVADAVIAPTRAFAAELRAFHGTGPVAWVPNGRRLPAPAAAAREAIIFSAGRVWDDAKNFAALDRAAARRAMPIAVAGPPAAPGGGPRAFPHLRLLGRLDAADMAAWHRRAAVFVSTAVYEPFGLAVLEAAQAGTPLVLSDIATFRELWEGAALFVDPRDAAAIAAALSRLMADAPLRARLGARARDRAARYTPARMRDATLEVYAGALARARLAACG